MTHRLQNLQLVPAQREIPTFDDLVVRMRDDLHFLQLADDFPGFVARECPGIQAIGAVATHQPCRFPLVMPPVGRRGEANQEGFLVSLPASQSDLLHDGSEGARDGTVRLVENDEFEVRQEPILGGLFRKLCIERLDRRDDDMEVADRLGPGLAGPHPGNAQTLPFGAHAGPDLPPCLHGLFAQLVAVRDPQDTACETVTNGFDNGLHRDAGLSRPRREADHPSTLTFSLESIAEHVSHPVYDGALVAMQFRK